MPAVRPLDGAQLDRYDELVPRLVDVRNRLSKLWTLPRISAQGLREIVTGPARLAGLDVSGVVELMAELHEEPGALPLVENALTWLWEQRTDDRLSGQLYIDQGGAAGILSRNADSLLEGLGDQQRERALELLLRLVNVDPEGRRHTRQRMSFAEAVEVAGGGGDGRRLVHHLAGHIVRAGGKPRDGLRLITITQDAAGGATVDRRGMLTP